MVLSSWSGHCESSRDSFDECRLNVGWPPTLNPSHPTWAVSPPVGCCRPHLPSPFISITQPESYMGVQPVPKAAYRSGCRDKHNCLRPDTLHSCMLPLDHCNLQRQMSVNNFPKVVTRQRSGRKSNSQPWSGKTNVTFTKLPSTLYIRPCIPSYTPMKF